MADNSSNFFNSKFRIATLAFCPILLATWIAAAFFDLGPYCTRFNKIYIHDNLPWRKFLVLRLQATHFSIELWETPQAEEFTFESNLIFQRNWAHYFSNATHDWGFIAFEDYRAGIGWVGRASRRQKPPTFSVAGTTFINIRWWFVALLAASPTLVYLGRRILHKHPHPPGICRRCGYDLRATPEKCPECGLPAQPNTR